MNSTRLLTMILLGVLLGLGAVGVAQGYVETTQPLVCDHGPRQEGPFDCWVPVGPACLQHCDGRQASLGGGR